MAKKRFIRPDRNIPLVFDWHKAADLIRTVRPKVARAFLKQQRSSTCGVIWRDGQPVYNTYTFLASSWDIPMIQLDDVVVECSVDPSETQIEPWFRFDGVTVVQQCGKWCASAKWPKSALDILSKFSDEME